tara:strand:+ start:170 stop:496 length:327 start_codon:yes stop_codon:yes gene_type:complete
MKETTMDTQTKNPRSLKQYIKWLKKAVEQGHLYDAEEYAKIKKELYQAKQLRKLVHAKERSLYGFGYIDDRFTSKTDLSDSRSGEDDGVRSESIEPEQPGESEGSGTP